MDAWLNDLPMKPSTPMEAAKFCWGNLHCEDRRIAIHRGMQRLPGKSRQQIRALLLQVIAKRLSK